MNNISERDICPICLEEMDSKKVSDMLILSCNHKIHEDCAKELTDSCCPICRQEVANWPNKLKDKIEENSKERQNEIINEETREIRDRFPTFIIQPSPQTVILAALMYLQELRIPLRYIPKDINIRSFRNNPSISPDILFSSIVGQVLEQVSRNTDEDDSEDHSDEDHSDEDHSDTDHSDTDEDSSDEDDPFSDENEELKNIIRKCEYNEE